MNRTRFRACAGAAAASYLLLAMPFTRHWLEASMVRHMLVQIPLLVMLGMIAARLLPPDRRRRLRHGCGGPLACLATATFASAYWMLPRALDAAIAEPLAELAKFVSLPLLVGLPLALAWESFGLIGRGFVWSNLISMQVFLGWLYLAAPQRVCNNYLADDQSRVGWLLIEIAAAIFACWLGALFRGGTAPPLLAPTA